MRWTLWLGMVGIGCQGEGLPDAGSTAEHPGGGSTPPCALTTVFEDADGDGFGDTATAREACAADPGEVTVGGDCDDAHAGTWPGADEVQGDGVDNDCDPATGLAPPITDLTLVDSVTGDDPADVLWMSSVGDLDGDGAVDFVASVLRAFSPSETGVISGPPGSGSFSDLAQQVLEADRWAASPLDLSGDGRPDFLTGGGWPMTVVSGGTTPVAQIVSADPQAGMPYNGTAFSRDLTGDGIPDLVLQVEGAVIGSPTPAIVVLPGPLTGAVHVSDGIVLPLLDKGLLTTGDLDGDGADDLVWATSEDDAQLLVAYGPITEPFDLLTAADARLTGTGWIGTLQVEGDLDGDGAEELIITRGDPRVLELAYGRRFGDGALVADVQLPLTAHSWPSATIVPGVPDSATASLVVGDYALHDFAGGVWVFHGPQSGTPTTPDWSFAGLSEGDLLGYAVDAVDWDGDGIPELVLSANGAHESAGAIYFVDIPTW